MKKIKLTQDKFTLVDDADFDFLNSWKWRYSTKGYAVRTSAMIGGIRGRNIWMHRLILGTSKGMQTDHKNTNKLDNRKENLRACTQSQNGMNQRKTRGSSRFKGVSWSEERKKWEVKLQKNKKNIYLGRFVDEEDAGRSYNAGALKHFGEFARLNVL